LIAAGVDLDQFRAQGLGPVNLETTLRYLHELRAHDTVTITSRTEWGTGKTSRIVQQLYRADGVLVAEVSSVSGLLDLSTRHLVPRPDQYWRAHATAPQMLDL
jgi:acyl-CoA thioester hydrolase